MSTAAPPPVADRVVSIGWGPRRLHHPILAAVIAFVVGVFATAMGAGIGIRHLTTTGLTGISVLGLALLFAGLALLGFGGVVAWRATHRWHRLWFIPIVVMTLLVMGLVATGRRGSPTAAPASARVTPADRGLAFSSVTFRTSDGVRLSAWYLPSTNSAAIVTLPGSGVQPHCDVRASDGARPARLRRADGRPPRSGPQRRARNGRRLVRRPRLTAAVTFLQHQPGVDGNRIGVLGLSMGGEQAIGAAAADSAIRAVVAEGATHRTAADKAGYLPGGVTGAIQRVLDKLTYGTAALLSPAPRNRARCTPPSPEPTPPASCSSPPERASTNPRRSPTCAPRHPTASRPGRFRAPRTCTGLPPLPPNGPPGSSGSSTRRSGRRANPEKVLSRTE